MVNKFGQAARVGKRGPAGAPGPSGPPGPQGPPGAGLSYGFFRKQMAQWLLENCAFSCYFPDLKSGFVYDKEKTKIGIKNRVGGRVAMSKKEVEELVRIRKDFAGYALKFSNSLYEIDKFDFALGNQCRAILMFTFKVKDYAENYQYMFYTNNEWRSVYLKAMHLVIQGSKTEQNPVAVKYKVGEWNKCFIVFSTVPGMSYYIINDETGTFETTPEEEHADFKFYIGSKGSYAFQGLMGRIDILLHQPIAEGEEKKKLSPIVRKSFMDYYYDDYY